MKEGSLEAPTRHPLAWREPDFYDKEALDEEARRVFDVCHGCRRCFNLCDSFPRLFDLIDESESMELDTVDSEDFSPVVDACTLCDMCYMTKCPYVPPHEFNLDFPHLMLRYRAVSHRDGKIGRADRTLAETDRNGKLVSKIPGAAAAANWVNDCDSKLGRKLLKKTFDIHTEAALPQFHGKTYMMRQEQEQAVNAQAPAAGRKAVFYATCSVNYNEPQLGMVAREVLARNGVEVKSSYPGCCGMPKLENGDLEAVAASAQQIAQHYAKWIDDGYDVIALTPSCALMMKFEWPLIAPENEEVKRLAEHTYDLSQYIVSIAQDEGLAEGLEPLDETVDVHLACHSRAQNMGPKGADLVRLIPETKVKVIERCSGHGGKWGIFADNFETAIKIGKPAARQHLKSGGKQLVSECPLAGEHLRQTVAAIDAEKVPQAVTHPIYLLARAYGISWQE